MKLAHRSALLYLIGASWPLSVACGSTDSLGLFSPTAGSASTSLGGAPGPGGGSSSAGQGAGGNAANGGGSSGSNASGAGQGTAGGNTGGRGVAGSGAAGSGGASSGGSAGATGGSGGNSAGSGGGNAGSGGSVAGTGGSAGGAGMSGCAPSVPVDGAMCVTPTPNGCFYPGVDCDCMPRSGGAAGFRGTWVCIGSRTPLCPQDLPSTGDACAARNGAQCPYSSTDVCTCALDMTLKWDCSADKNFSCPPQAPNAGSICTVEAMCQYPDDDCFCNGTRWVCQS
jgi:hypothetical protein